jgi:hypothetical protein
LAKSAIHTNLEIERLKRKKEKVIPNCYENTKTETAHICSRVMKDKTCSAYAYPQAKWRAGDCPLADLELQTPIIKEDTKKTRVGQQKQKKR